MTTLQDTHRRAQTRPHTRVIASLVASIVAFSSSPSIAREVYDIDGYIVETTGAVEDLPGDTLIRIGITIPPDGYVFLTTQGSFELYMPCKGWVPDKGIIIIVGCPEEERGGDTLNGPVTLTPDIGCSNKGGRVLALVRVPRMFVTKDCRPTQLRWTGGYHAKTD